MASALFPSYLTRNSTHPWYCGSRLYHHSLHNLGVRSVVVALRWRLRWQRASGLTGMLALASFYCICFEDVMGSRGPADGYQWPHSLPGAVFPRSSAHVERAVESQRMAQHHPYVPSADGYILAGMAARILAAGNDLLESRFSSCRRAATALPARQRSARKYLRE